MAKSLELESYPESYIDELSSLLDYVAASNPGIPAAQLQQLLRGVAQDLRVEEQLAITKIESSPFSAGSRKTKGFARYVPLYHNKYFIKYQVFPLHTTTQKVQFVLLEKLIRQNSGAYNANFIDDLKTIDVSN